jgi:hypothetical protein
MTSVKQIEANRRNALRSTGPTSEDGKQRASRNAVRHGLTAETVVEPLEDPEDYKAFEQAVASNYDAESAVERELVLRLASLLWRLRRTTSIETGLMQIEGEVLREQEQAKQKQKTPRDGALTALFRLRKRASDDPSDWNQDGANHHALDDPGTHFDAASASPVPDAQKNIAQHFLRLAKLDNGAFERLGRYEMALWRQVRQTLFTLEAIRWRSSSARYPGAHLWRRTIETPPE